MQQLEQQVAQAQTATVIAKEAKKLGLRPESRLTFIDLRSKKILDQPGTTATELAGRRDPAKAGRHRQAKAANDPRAAKDPRAANDPRGGKRITARGASQ